MQVFVRFYRLSDMRLFGCITPSIKRKSLLFKKHIARLEVIFHLVQKELRFLLCRVCIRRPNIGGVRLLIAYSNRIIMSINIYHTPLPLAERFLKNYLQTMVSLVDASNELGNDFQLWLLAVQLVPLN